MIGLIDLSWVGLIVGGGLIALIMYNIPTLRVIARNPLLALGSGIFISYLLDDYSELITKGDIIVSLLMIVTLIVTSYPIIMAWAKSRKKIIENIQKRMNIMENKLSNIDGKIETILNFYPRKKNEK